MHRCDACHRWTTDRHAHHVMPLAVGGVDDPSNLVDICGDCHAKLHELPHRFLNHRELVRAGIAAAKARGVRIGKPPRLTAAQVTEAVAMRDRGMLAAHIARHFGVCPASISRILAKHRPEAKRRLRRLPRRQRQLVRDLRQTGATPLQLAERFGVGLATIYRVLGEQPPTLSND